MSDPEQVSEQLQSAIADAVGDDKHRILQGWLLVSEWLTDDGDRVIDVYAAPDARIWQLQGYAEWARVDLAEQQSSGYEADE